MFSCLYKVFFSTEMEKKLYLWKINQNSLEEMDSKMEVAITLELFLQRQVCHSTMIQKQKPNIGELLECGIGQALLFCK